MEKYKKVYNPVTIVGVKYMEHVCSPGASYKVPAFARVYNLPESLLPLYNAVKTDHNTDDGHARMIDWAKVMNMHFSPDSYPTNCFSYSDYFIESDSDHRTWDNEIIMDLLLSYNMEEDQNIAPQLRDKLSRKIEHIPYMIVNKLGMLIQWAERYEKTWIKPTASSNDELPDDIRNVYTEIMNGISYYVTNGKLFISKYGDRLSKCPIIIETLKNQIEKASVYVKY